jgi:hypothetical protein
LLFTGGKIAGSSYSGNYVLVVIAFTFGDDDNFVIEID